MFGVGFSVSIDQVVDGAVGEIKIIGLSGFIDELEGFLGEGIGDIFIFIIWIGISPIGVGDIGAVQSDKYPVVPLVFPVIAGDAIADEIVEAVFGQVRLEGLGAGVGVDSVNMVFAGEK